MNLLDRMAGKLFRRGLKTQCLRCGRKTRVTGLGRFRFRKVPKAKTLIRCKTCGNPWGRIYSREPDA